MVIRRAKLAAKLLAPLRQPLSAPDACRPLDRRMTILRPLRLTFFPSRSLRTNRPKGIADNPGGRIISIGPAPAREAKTRAKGMATGRFKSELRRFGHRENARDDADDMRTPIPIELLWHRPHRGGPRPWQPRKHHLSIHEDGIVRGLAATGRARSGLRSCSSREDQLTLMSRCTAKA